MKGAAARLRTLADWIEAHDVYDNDLVAVSTDGFEELYVHMKIEPGLKVLAGKNVTFDENGHAHVPHDGVMVVMVTSKQ